MKLFCGFMGAAKLSNLISLAILNSKLCSFYSTSANTNGFTKMYIGLRKDSTTCRYSDANCPKETRLEGWYWEDGSSMEWSNWWDMNSVPSGGETRSLMLLDKDFKWDDYGQGTIKVSALCERPKGE